MIEFIYKKLIGEWVIDSSDIQAIERFGVVTMEFKENGILIYRNHNPDKTIVSLLVFSIDDTFIITNQPSSPKEERTAYSFIKDGKLMLTLGKQRSLFIKVAPGRQNEESHR